MSGWLKSAGDMKRSVVALFLVFCAGGGSAAHAPEWQRLPRAAEITIIPRTAALSSQANPVVSADADPRFRTFNSAIERYLALHEQLRKEVPGPVANSSAQEITRASDQLAAAIQRARPRAGQGDFFDAEATRAIRQRITEELSSPSSTVDIETIDDEQAASTRPGVYLRFPAAAELATMPPSLLRVLPHLPGELEYRIMGEYLVIRDVKAALILDYIAGAVPRRKR